MSALILTQVSMCIGKFFDINIDPSIIYIIRNIYIFLLYFIYLYFQVMLFSIILTCLFFSIIYNLAFNPQFITRITIIVSYNRPPMIMGVFYMRLPGITSILSRHRSLSVISSFATSEFNSIVYVHTPMLYVHLYKEINT